MDTPSPKRRLALIAIGIVIAAGLAFVAISRGRGHGELTLYGNIDIRDVTLGFRVAGRLASLAVDEGDAVRAGQELARLDAIPIQLELDEARATASAIGARLALLKSGYRPEDVEQAGAAVAERRAALTNAE